MRISNQFLIIVVFLILICTNVNAQSALRPTYAGIYQSGIIGQVGIGTDLERKYFGEIRFIAADILEAQFGIEGSVNRNLYRDDWFNFHVGIMAGYYSFGDIRLGVPIGFTIKPIENHRNFAVVMEATPNFFTDGYTNLRGNIGLRYTFRKN